MFVPACWADEGIVLSNDYTHLKYDLYIFLSVSKSII